MLGPADGGGLSDTVSARDVSGPTVIPPGVDDKLAEAQARRDDIAMRQREGVDELLRDRGPGGGMGRPSGPAADGRGGQPGSERGALAQGTDRADPRGPAAGAGAFRAGNPSLSNDVPVQGRGQVPQGPAEVSQAPPQPAGPAFNQAVVKEGDTLWKIAKQAYGDGDVGRMVDLILEANPEVAADLIQPGQVLKLPSALPAGVVTRPLLAPTDPVTKPQPAAGTQPGASLDGTVKPSGEAPTQATTGDFRFYEVREGDTLDAIAKREIGSDATFHDIWVLNRERLESPERIYPGQTLRLPAKR